MNKIRSSKISNIFRFRKSKKIRVKNLQKSNFKSIILGSNSVILFLLRDFKNDKTEHIRQHICCFFNRGRLVCIAIYENFEHLDIFRLLFTLKPRNHSYRNSVGSGGDDPPPLEKFHPPPPSTCGPQI